MHELLPHLAQAAREARLAAALTYAHVAVHVRKSDGSVGVSESTLSRFERAKHWPENPDVLLAAYATALGVPVRELWARALDGLPEGSVGRVDSDRDRRRRRS
jgi:transcriptional regulator with XRE-family HTH domain